MMTESARRKSAPSFHPIFEAAASPLERGQLPLRSLERPKSPLRKNASTAGDKAQAGGEASPVHVSHGSSTHEKDDFKTNESMISGGQRSSDNVSVAESAVLSEAVERSLMSIANAVAVKVCPEVSETVSGVIHDSLANQARDLINLLQPLCSELGVAAHRLTMAVQRAELQAAELEGGTSSDSSASDLASRKSPRSASNRTADTGNSYTREPRVASAPELPMPTKKTKPPDPVDIKQQSATLSVLPDVRFGTHDSTSSPESGGNTTLGKPHRQYCKEKASANNEKWNSYRKASKSHSATSHSATKGSSGRPPSADRARGRSLGSGAEKGAASLIGVAKGGSTRQSTWQHLSYTTELRFLQDSLASELFKATYLVPGTPGSNKRPTNSAGSAKGNQKSWMPTSPTRKISSPKTSAAKQQSMAAIGNNFSQLAIGSSVRQQEYPSNESRNSGRNEVKFNNVQLVSPCITEGGTTSPRSSSQESIGSAPEVLDLGRTERPSLTAPAQTSVMQLMQLPSACGEVDNFDKIETQSEGGIGLPGEMTAESELAGEQKRRRKKTHSTPVLTRSGSLSQVHSYDSCTSLNPKTAKEVRQLNEKELTKSISIRPSSAGVTSRHSFSSETSVNSEDEDPSSARYLEQRFEIAARDKALIKISDALLRICGVLPWSERSFWFSGSYFCVLVLLVVLATVSCLQQVFDTSCNHTRTTLGKLSDTAFTLGALAVLSACRMRQRELSDCNALLVSYAQQRGFLQNWAKIARHDGMLSVMVWICIVLERIRAYIMSPDECDDDSVSNWIAVMQICSFVFASMLLLTFVHYILYIARFLSSMIDTFCCRFVELPDFTEAVTEWNVLQAVIRKSCETIQYCFFALQTTTTVAALLNVVDITEQASADPVFFLELLPGTLIVLLVIRMFFCAGAVTDKCARVPSLVNSLSFGTDLDRDRLYVVEYIAHSQAGFYIFEVRLTSATVLKIFYFSCVVALALATRIASDY